MNSIFLLLPILAIALHRYLGILFSKKDFRTSEPRRGIINRDLYPFEKYKISKLKSQSKKRALTIDEFKRIRDLDLSMHPTLVEAHKLFMFSFYCRGINFIDIMHLKWSNIQDGRIYYTRSKNKGQFNVEIIEKAQEIINYYKGQNRPTQYVFPILLDDDLTPIQIENRKHKVIGRCNARLKELANLADIDKNVTFYVARQSFATILKQTGTSTDVISELMGHSDVQITSTYLKAFDNDVLGNENRRLLDLSHMPRCEIFLSGKIICNFLCNYF